MKKVITFLLVGTCLLAGKISQAQVYIGARGGLSIPNLSAGGSQQNPLNTGYSSRTGPDFGIFADFRISKLFSIEPMLEYSSQGGKKDGYQALTVPAGLAQLFPPGQVPPYLYATYNSEAKLNYLLVPILGKFGWNFHPHSPWRFYVDAGPFAGFLLSAKQVTSGSSAVYLDPQKQEPIQQAGTVSFDNTQDIKSQLHTFNMGVSGNVGINYHFDRNNIFLEAGGNYGFLNIQKGTANGKNNTGAATISLGYAYKLAKL